VTSEADRPAPVPSPPGATESEAGPGPSPDLRDALARLDPVARGGSRPTREDFEAVARDSNAFLARDPGRPGSRAIESYALGGVAYLDGKDGEALRFLLVAQAQGGRVGPWDVRVLRSTFARVQGNDGTVGWELALAYGDVRREAEALLAKDLARDPADPRALLGRAVLRRMERRSAEAIADATAVFERHPAGSLRAAAAELVAAEHASAKAWEDAAHWFRKAAIPQGPASAHAGWEGARILEEKLGRPDEARELYAVACRAGNRKACLATGEPAPRPKRFPRRRGP
jgi:tetratricopeptide (TPR) repeat protein